MIKKLINFYVYLYISEDKEHNKPRIEVRRLLFLTVNIFFLVMFFGVIIAILFNGIGEIIGVYK